jgi:hypothetical protein
MASVDRATDLIEPSPMLPAGSGRTRRADLAPLLLPAAQPMTPLWPLRERQRFVARGAAPRAESRA